MDLHVHTCLSPCADNSMVPRTIVERAKQAGLDAVGICDHNAAANVQAVREVGREAGIGVLAGLEVTTAEKPSRRFSLKKLRLPRSEWPWRQETDGELSRLGPGIPDR
jgi:DNA polymerase III alpha subunit